MYCMDCTVYQTGIEGCPRNGLDAIDWRLDHGLDEVPTNRIWASSRTISIIAAPTLVREHRGLANDHADLLLHDSGPIQPLVSVDVARILVAMGIGFHSRPILVAPSVEPLNLSPFESQYRHLTRPEYLAISSLVSAIAAVRRSAVAAAASR